MVECSHAQCVLCTLNFKRLYKAYKCRTKIAFPQISILIIFLGMSPRPPLGKGTVGYNRPQEPDCRHSLRRRASSRRSVCMERCPWPSQKDSLSLSLSTFRRSSNMCRPTSRSTFTPSAFEVILQ